MSASVILTVQGEDRPGILHPLTSALARHDISAEELTTEIQPAPMSGEDLFIARASLLVPADSDTEALKAEIEQLADELMVDIDLKQ